MPECASHREEADICSHLAHSKAEPRKDQDLSEEVVHINWSIGHEGHLVAAKRPGLIVFGQSRAARKTVVHPREHLMPRWSFGGVNEHDVEIVQKWVESLKPEE